MDPGNEKAPERPGAPKTDDTQSLQRRSAWRKRWIRIDIAVCAIPASFFWYFAARKARLETELANLEAGQ
jgi:hypothetical protein